VQIRVGNSRSQWVEGKALIFDESFEHEVWNNATTPRLVLIIDVWQPALEMDARRKLLELRERWKRDERSFIDGLFQAPSG
jgi:aspartyl/asparaginyl beta-hydroxylase (cupin superfamily)